MSKAMFSVVPTNHDICCNVCNARNYDREANDLVGEYTGTIFDISAGRITMHLCRRCLYEFQRNAKMALIEAGRPEVYAIVKGSDFGLHVVRGLGSRNEDGSVSVEVERSAFESDVYTFLEEHADQMVFYEREKADARLAELRTPPIG